jgi:hypothetical protein
MAPWEAATSGPRLTKTFAGAGDSAITRAPAQNYCDMEIGQSAPLRQSETLR